MNTHTETHKTCTHKHTHTETHKTCTHKHAHRNNTCTHKHAHSLATHTSKHNLVQKLTSEGRFSDVEQYLTLI